MGPHPCTISLRFYNWENIKLNRAPSGSHTGPHLEPTRAPTWDPPGPPLQSLQFALQSLQSLGQECGSEQWDKDYVERLNINMGKHPIMEETSISMEEMNISK